MTRARLALGLWLLASAAAAQGEPAPAQAPRRIVSMNPSLTAILVALGAQGQIVGIDEFSARQQPQLAALPRVGGLYNPSLEVVVGLRPELVVLVPSFEQRDFRRRLEESGIPLLAFDPLGFDEVLETIIRLGSRVGRAEAARSRVRAIRAARREVMRATAPLERPSTVLVIQRDPLFVIGRGSFVDEMLGAVGAENVGARLAEPYPRASIEWLIGMEPEVILDSAPDPDGAKHFWARWPSLPAVRRDRVVSLPQGQVTLPGPYLDRALKDLARAIHGSDFEERGAAP